MEGWTNLYDAKGLLVLLNDAIFEGSGFLGSSGSPFQVCFLFFFVAWNDTNISKMGKSLFFRVGKL